MLLMQAFPENWHRKYDRGPWNGLLIAIPPQFSKLFFPESA
jgi:hypothetical protein